MGQSELEIRGSCVEKQVGTVSKCREQVGTVSMCREIPRQVGTERVNVFKYKDTEGEWVEENYRMVVHMLRNRQVPQIVGMQVLQIVGVQIP